MKKISHLSIIAIGLVCIGILTLSLIALRPSPAPSALNQVDITKSQDRPEPDNNQSQTIAQKTNSNTSPSTTSAAAPSYGTNDQIAQSDDNQPTIITSDGKVYPLRTYKPLASPNDPYANQWWTTNSGLNDAWNLGAGSYQTTVAVIDSGFALDHEEFIDRWHTNQGEYGPTDIESDTTPNCSSRGLALDKSCNGIDDDGNGLIDDVRGWDFSNSDNSVLAGETNPDGTGTTHGTLVSGVLAASGNNNKGIAGVNWSAKILPIQALDDDSYGDTWTVAQSVRYAADQKADIISISLGSEAPDPYLREAIGYAIKSGSLVVAASGNDGCDCVLYPANYPEVLAVGSYNSSGQKSAFSSYGSSLDILAPGENMIAPTWTKSNQLSAYASGVSGTSFSTPYISGLIALAKSHLPNASWGELTATLTGSSGHSSLTASSPYSSTIGFGYAHASRFINRIVTPKASSQRHQLGPLTISDPLGTERTYQCENGQIPTTRLYELTKNGVVRFTNSELTRHTSTQDGWSSKFLFYACTGLPNDTTSSLRTINLYREIYNRGDKQ
ncbi:hypothetical protein B7Y94_01070 [Candidatus Saccharibacteria bacterium 32-49-12]|nr:MAG: hypothetical protein B7Y94_01070 [Candidatus Saccharibacteria bacterium 32-49-12]